MWKANETIKHKVLEDENVAWDASAARERIFFWAGFDGENKDTERARSCFLVYDDENLDNRDGYKLPVCDIIDGEAVVVPKAVFAAAAALSGARGGVDLPSDVAEKLKDVVAGIYEQMNRPSPFAKSLKFSESGELRGYGVVFGGRDLEGEHFEPETDFWIDKLQMERYPVLYDHGQHGFVRHAVIGYAKAHKDDVGIWLDIELQKANEYRDYVALVRGLAEEGVLGVSSGAVAHLVKKTSDGVITEWPIVEFSLTPTPAEPRTVGVELLKSISSASKSYRGLLERVEAERSEEADARVEQAEGANASAENIKKESGKDSYMSEQMVYHVEKKDYTFADFLRAARYRDVDTLRAIGVKAVTESGSGGYLVPEQMVEQVLSVQGTTLGEILRRTMTIRNPRSNVVNVPTLDQTAGQHGGVVVTLTSEGAAKTSTEPTFAQTQLVLYKLAGYTQVSDELLDDSGVALEAMLAGLFRSALTNEVEKYIMVGTGTSQPTGFLADANSALIKITRGTAGDITLADIANMYAAQVNPNNAVWIASPSAVGKLLQISSNVIAWMRDLSASVPATIMGRPLLVSYHASPLGAGGDLSFVDLSQMVVAMTDPAIDVSRDYGFVNDVTTWRFVLRVGAKPNTYAKIQVGTGVYVSPFVTLE